MKPPRMILFAWLLAFSTLLSDTQLPSNADQKIPQRLQETTRAQELTGTRPPKGEATGVQTGTSYVNSLGMKFVPVPGTTVLFSIWETRVQDYAVFANAVSGVDDSWKKPGFAQEGTHPVVKTSWDDGKKFCEWLTKKERNEGRITEKQEYRYPTDVEWSAAVGLTGESGNTPKERDRGVKNVYPWGTQWPPPRGAGNYDSFSSSSLGTDSFDRTSPVGSFAANAFGLFDLGGNAWEWCEDYYDGSSGSRVSRGASWRVYYAGILLSSYRYINAPTVRGITLGFRCVLVGGGSR